MNSTKHNHHLIKEASDVYSKNFLFNSYFVHVLGLSYVVSAQSIPNAETAGQKAEGEDDLKEWNNQIRREKFDLVLPEAMRKNRIDMWIHVMRVAVPDRFGAEDLGSTSGVFVFTDRGGDRIERAILGRRWGATQRERGEQSDKIEKSGAYDIIHDPVFVQEPLASPMTEYDYRFKGLREFVEAQMHMIQPKNNFPVYSEGFDPEKTLLSVDSHGMGKGARNRKYQEMRGPRIGSYGPEWTYDIPLPPNHHFVLEYFFYMPSSTSNKDEDQYLFFWDHEQAIATKSGVEYLTPLKKELYLIK